MRAGIPNPASGRGGAAEDCAMNDVASPCCGVCRIDDGTGLCAGCLRTIDEIAAWPTLVDAAKRAVWRDLQRRRALRRRCHEHRGFAPEAK
jgi:uncharacterized protein